MANTKLDICVNISSTTGSVGEVKMHEVHKTNRDKCAKYCLGEMD